MGGGNIKIVFQHLLFFFSRMLLCLKVFCKATNGQCVVVPAASWSAFCQTRKLSRRKVQQHFFPPRRVNLRKPFVVRLHMKVTELYVVALPAYCFSAGSAGVSPPTHPVAIRLLAGSISHNSTPKTAEHPFMNWVYLPSRAATIASAWQYCCF